MITISLDETGVFEQTENNNIQNNVPKMIAGVLYDDHGKEEDAENERKRIDAYYQAVFDEAGDSDYPKDLHVDRRCQNNGNVRRIKSIVGETIGKFLQDGTFRGAQLLPDMQREGSYSLYALVKSDAGKEVFRTTQNNSINDTRASNLYLNMTEDIVTRLVFHHVYPDTETLSFALELATRSVSVAQNNASEYENQGYFLREGDHTFITDADVYRTMLRREMVLTHKQKVKISSLTVPSINYNFVYDPMNTDGPEHRKLYNQLFLYLADSICSALTFQLNSNGDGQIPEIQNRMKTLAGEDRIILFVYDDVDDDYDLAVRAFEDGRIYESLSHIWDGMQREGQAAAIYKNCWFKKLFERMESDSTPSMVREAIKTLNETVYENNLEVPKHKFLYEKLEKIAEGLSDSRAVSEVLFDLYDAGVSDYDHYGMPKEAQECYAKAMKHTDYAGIEQVLRMQNKIAGQYNDAFQFKKSLDLCNQNVQVAELMDKARTVVMKETETRTPDPQIHTILGESLSQRGQAKSFLLRDDAEDDFQKAIKLLGDSTTNARITQSYLLHYYIEMRKKDDFVQCFSDYLQCNGMKEWLQSILINGYGPSPRFSLSYALYIYVKGWTVFFEDHPLKNQLRSFLEDAENYLENYCEGIQSLMHGHPWELIYKYLALLCLHYGLLNEAEKYRILSKTCIKDAGTILQHVSDYGEIEIFEAAGDKKAAKCTDNLFAKVFPDAGTCDSGEKRARLSSCFTYMYH